MTIDRGSPIGYNANFPVAGINQSSQTFRDNFGIIKFAIENLHAAAAADGSVLDISATVLGSGAIRYSLAYPNNLFVLPQGDPIIPPRAGALRYDQGVVQYHNGASWVQVGEGGGSGGGGTVDLSFAFTDNIELGVNAIFDSVTGKVNLVANNFAINLTGAITGSALVNHLTDVTIDTSLGDLTLGITTQYDGVATGASNSVRTLNFRGDGISVVQTGSVAIVTVPNALSLVDVRNEVGQFVRGTVRDPFLNVNTETGITVNYDAENNALELGVREFDVILTGAVTGIGRSTRLQDILIETSTDRIRGINVDQNGLPLGLPESVRRLNFTGNGVVASQSGETATLTISGLTAQDVRDTIGATVRGTFLDFSNQETETGIIVNYDAQNQRLELALREFDILLTGAVTGVGRSTRLRDVVIETTTDRIRGIAFERNGTPLGLDESVRRVNITGDFVSAAQAGDLVTLDFSGITEQDIRDTIGSTVRGTVRDQFTNIATETGITVNYDAQNNALELGVREFDINLTGAVVGTGRVTRLQDVTINTTTDRIRGVTAQWDGVQLGTTQQIQTLNFTGSALNVSRSGSVLTVNVPGGLTTTDVIDTVGTVVSGTQRDPNTNIATETGITVNYDAENNRVELGVREFDIILTGAVTGSGRVSRLQNTTIVTSSNFITGLTVQKDGILSGAASSIRTLNFVGSAVSTSVSGNVATISVTPNVDNAAVRDVTGAMVDGNHRGLQAIYDAQNGRIRLALNPINITMTGAISGSGTINFTGAANDGSVVIVTEGSTINAGIEVRDEGVEQGSTVSAINFVGGGVTTAVSVDGQVATVFIPNSPGNEKFLVVDNGSENIPNARKFTAGSGITFIDGGPGEEFIISAVSDSIIAKSQYLNDGYFAGERATLDVISTQKIIARLEDDSNGNRMNMRLFAIEDAWFREPNYDCGFISDKYGNSIDLGKIRAGIIQAVADLGQVV